MVKSQLSWGGGGTVRSGDCHLCLHGCPCLGYLLLNSETREEAGGGGRRRKEDEPDPRCCCCILLLVVQSNSDNRNMCFPNYPIFCHLCYKWVVYECTLYIVTYEFCFLFVELIEICCTPLDKRDLSRSPSSSSSHIIIGAREFSPPMEETKKLGSLPSLLCFSFFLLHLAKMT